MSSIIIMKESLLWRVGPDINGTKDCGLSSGPTVLFKEMLIGYPMALHMLLKESSCPLM